MKLQFGIPVATSATIDSVLAEFGIKPWEKVKPSMDLAEYLAGELTEQERTEATRFAPKNQVVFLEQPNGNPFTGYRSTGKDWAAVFTLLPGDLVPIVAEWKHGAETISLAPPSGVLSKTDNGSMEAAGRREFKEETGMELATIERLGSPNGIGVSTRQSTQRFHAFLGTVVTPVNPGKSKLDATEHLKLILVPLYDWLKIIDTRVEEDCAISITHLALRKLRRA